MARRTLARFLAIALAADLLAIGAMAVTDALGGPGWAAPTVGVITFAIAGVATHRMFGASLRRLIDRHAARRG